MLKSEGLKSALGMSVGNIGATTISAVAMIIFSRALGPTQFGVFSVLFSLLLILSRVGDLGLNVAIQRIIAKNSKDQKLIKQTVAVGTSLKLIIALFILLIGVFLGPVIAISYLKLSSDSTLLVQLVFTLSLGVIFYEYVNTILQGLQFFTLSILSNWIQSGIKFAVAMASLITSGLSLFLITILYLLAPIFGGLLGLVRIPFANLIPLWDRKIVKQLLSVSRWTGIAIIAATIADNFDVLIVQNMLSSYATGLYSSAVRIASIASLAAYSLGIVLNVRVAQYHDKANLNKYLKKALLLALASFIGVSLLSILSYPALLYTVGPEFTSAAPVLNLLFLATAILTATTPYVALFYLFDRPEYFAYSGIIGTIILLGLDLLLIPLFNLHGAAYARIISRLGVLIFTLYYAVRSYHAQYGKS